MQSLGSPRGWLEPILLETLGAGVSTLRSHPQQRAGALIHHHPVGAAPGRGAGVPSKSLCLVGVSAEGIPRWQLWS